MEKVSASSRVKVGQIWEVAQDNGRRRAEVINILGQWVELRYLDMPGASDRLRVRSFTIYEMADRQKFRRAL